MKVIFDRKNPAPEVPANALQGKAILLLAAPAGNATQEVLNGLPIWERLGAEITVATAGAGAVRFDPVCNVLAVAEAAWSPTLKLIPKYAEKMESAADLRQIEKTGGLETFVDGFDAVVVVGGHGKIFGDFVRDPLVHHVLGLAHDNGLLVGLICHAVAASAWVRLSDGQTLAAGRQITCWPSNLEHLFAAPPAAGAYFKPFGRWVEDICRDAGATVIVTKSPRSMPDAVVDGQLVTTWGPWAVEGFARALAWRLTHTSATSAPTMPRPGTASKVTRQPFIQNWCENFSCRPMSYYEPDSVEQIVDIIGQARRDNRVVRSVGSAYSYTRLIQTDEVLISLDNFKGIESVDRERGVARVRGGTKLYELMPQLAEMGLTVETCGDINRQSLAGVCATGSHGTGMGTGIIPTMIERFNVVTGRGDVIAVDRTQPDLFRALQVNLGVLGIVTHIDLRVVPLYYLSVHRWPTDIEAMIDGYSEHIQNNRNFEFFWYPGMPIVSAKRMNIVPKPSRDKTNSALRFFNEIFVENGLGWAVSESLQYKPEARKFVEQIAPKLVIEETTVRPAHEAYPTPRLVKHQEIEYAVPIEHTSAALRDLNSLYKRFPVLTVFPVEVRFVPKDDIFLSPVHERDCVYLAAHTYIKEDHREYFDRCEEIFTRYGGRPHWGKLHTRTASDFARLYPSWSAFHEIRRGMDPDGIFLNTYLRRLFGDAA